MTKVRFHGPIAGFSGAMGEMVFADQGERTVVYMKPKRGEMSEAQLAWNEHWDEAQAYAQSAMADPDKHAFYKMVADEKDVPIYSLMIGDYLNAPSFKPLDLRQYKGQVGNPILIRAIDDVGLVSVEVELITVAGTHVEKGKAVEVGARSGNWVYTATASIPEGTDLFIEVIGVDHTGHQVKMTENPIVGADK